MSNASVSVPPIHTTGTSEAICLVRENTRKKGSLGSRNLFIRTSNIRVLGLVRKYKGFRFTWGILIKGFWETGNNRSAKGPSSSFLYNL